MTFILTDESLLESFEARLQLIRDRVRSVAEGYHTAAYLVGRPGTSKTHTVREELERRRAPFLIRNSRMSPMGLFELLEENPEHIIVLDALAANLIHDSVPTLSNLPQHTVLGQTCFGRNTTASTDAVEAAQCSSH